MSEPSPNPAQANVAHPVHLGQSCHADGLSPESSTSESDTVLRSAHLEQDEALRQDNRQKAQQQKATTGLSGQVSGPNGQASPIVAELQRESDEANRQDSLQKAQEQKAQDEASREESLQRAQAVVSPFTRATVHRQIGVMFMSATNPQQTILCKQLASTDLLRCV